MVMKFTIAKGIMRKLRSQNSAEDSLCQCGPEMNIYTHTQWVSFLDSGAYEK